LWEGDGDFSRIKGKGVEVVLSLFAGPLFILQVSARTLGEIYIPKGKFDSKMQTLPTNRRIKTKVEVPFSSLGDF